MDKLLDDFITNWSRYILTNHNMRLGYGADYLALVALANLGQKNAIQSVMLFDFIKQANKDVLLDIISKQTAGDLDSDQIIFNYLTNVDKVPTAKQRESLFKELIAKHNKKLTSLFDMERLLEIKYANGIYKHHEVAMLRKKLKAKYEENPYDPEIAFSYGKNLLFFSMEENSKEIKLGAKILSHLADREYSEQLKEEIANLKSLLEEQKEISKKETKKFLDDFLHSEKYSISNI